MLSRFNLAQQLLLLLGAVAGAVQVWYPPYVEVGATPPLFDNDPPHIQRPRRLYPVGRGPISFWEGGYYPYSIGVYRDTPSLALNLLDTALVAAAACGAVEVYRRLRTSGRPSPGPSCPAPPGPCGPGRPG